MKKFQRNGTAHLLAASGLHVGVVYGFIALLLRGKRRFSIQLLIMASLVFYAASRIALHLLYGRNHDYIAHYSQVISLPI